MLIGGKGFAYTGFSPLFITEIFIVLIFSFSLLNIFFNRSTQYPFNVTPFFIFFGILYAICLTYQILNIPEGMDGFRDSVIIIYSVWAFFTVYHLSSIVNWYFLKYTFISAAFISLFKYFSSIYTLLVLKQIPSFEGFRFNAGYILPPLFVLMLILYVKKFKIHHLATVLFFILSIITSFHRSIYLGFLFSLSWIFFVSNSIIKKRIIIFGMVGTVSAFFLALLIYIGAGIESSSIKHYLKIKATGKGGNVSYRTTSWKIALKKYASAPVFGIGVGTPLMYSVGNEFFEGTKGLSYREVKQSGGNAFIHNSQLTFLTRYGAVGYFIKLCAMAFILFLLVKKWRHSSGINQKHAILAVGAIIYFFIYSNFNVVLEGPHDGSLYWIAVGFGMSVCLWRFKDASIQ